MARQRERNKGEGQRETGRDGSRLTEKDMERRETDGRADMGGR
jgi:hypothetical protein